MRAIIPPRVPDSIIYVKILIYKATNLVNNKVYIGQTTQTLQDRIYHHKKDSYRTDRPKVYFHNAIFKYGIDNFKFEVIEYCDNVEMLNEREIYWISYYDSTNKDKGYNLDSGGRNGGCKCEETKQKMSAATLKNWEREEYREKALKGLRDGTKKFQEICKYNREHGIHKVEKVDFKCICCGKIIKLFPGQVKERKFCSQECSMKYNTKERFRALHKIEVAEKRYKLIREEVYIWSRNNSDIIMSCPFNKVSTCLKELYNLLKDKYDVKDWRTICKALGVEGGRKNMVLYIRNYLKTI